MIDVFLKYQVNIFINTTSIIPETDIIFKLLDLFKDYGFIPNTIYEIVAGGPRPRLMMSSTDNKWNIEYY